MLQVSHELKEGSEGESCIAEKCHYSVGNLEQKWHPHLVVETEADKDKVDGHQVEAMIGMILHLYIAHYT